MLNNEEIDAAIARHAETSKKQFESLPAEVKNCALARVYGNIEDDPRYDIQPSVRAELACLRAKLDAANRNENPLLAREIEQTLSTLATVTRERDEAQEKLETTHIVFEETRDEAVRLRDERDTALRERDAAREALNQLSTAANWAKVVLETNLGESLRGASKFQWQAFLSALSADPQSGPGASH